MIIFRNDIQKGGKDYEEVAERLLRLINPERTPNGVFPGQNLERAGIIFNI